eukprot:CAMPEP_0115038542 /NCGR_PEP_ID=MMETSP0216-20121206/43468_1 /TAXON_ID=223996 /ORGANISM="Protocruzia adherens, Strain Boccale" /LENGTH=224 /DNA_ID=CAMNT_0002418957 /DNA_START=266 /DNA_END=940 /DNA_ORIENTATION=+
MRTLIVSCLALTALFAITLATDPEVPIWRDQFSQTFTETTKYKILGSHDTAGTYYYDWTNNRARTDRDNGRWDRYCGFNGLKFFKNTPCTQLVVDGMRWMIYPELKECCACCSAAHGCGVLKPSWVSAGKYIGQTSATDGTPLYKWDVKGGQSNYYYETVQDNPADRVMHEIYQVSDDDQIFDISSLSENIDESVWALPPNNETSKTCSFLSVCNAVSHFIKLP